MPIKSLYRKENAILANLLRQLRLDANMTQVECAEMLGKSQSYISTVESGQQRLDLLQLREYCSAFGVPLTTFVKRFEAALASL